MGSLLVAFAFLAGLLATWLWMQSNAKWRAHQHDAYVAGLTLYNALQDGTAPPNGIAVVPLGHQDQTHARAGDFRRISGASQSDRLTTVPILQDAVNRRTGAPLTLTILSPDLVYPLANLPHREGQTAAETTAAVIRLLATYCSDPLVLAQMGGADWVALEGAPVWGCDAAPADRRLLAGLLAAVALAVLITAALNTSGDFINFADQLRARRRLGGPTRYQTPGPQELQDIVGAVNSYLEAERTQLVNRAAVLSGVSHDLGTPATRLRLRTALIPDAELRGKLEADIDSMTGIIESVLTYTRAEMSAEEPRKLSLNSLIDAIVADYQDMGSAVTFRQASDVIVQGGRSVFMSRQGQSVVSGNRELIILGRPVALERAVTNLVDNALKYGRRATVSLQADATEAMITVEDEGSQSSAAEIEALMEPFRRGDNATSISGHGLGLTIVATIAQLHGGTLTFEDTGSGLRACLTIERG